MDLKKDAEQQFHDSLDSEDIYDLYNACNGIVRDGLLDIGQLDEYTPDEAEELNVMRLREIWSHTATGCRQCHRIVNALNSFRGMLGEDEEPFDEQTGALDIDVIDTIS